MIGLYAALAVLDHRDRTGQGQYIDLSGYKVVCSLIGPTLMDVASNKREVLPQGNSPRHPPYRSLLMLQMFRRGPVVCYCRIE